MIVVKFGLYERKTDEIFVIFSDILFRKIFFNHNKVLISTLMFVSFPIADVN